MSAVLQTEVRRHRLTVDDFHRMGEAGILRADERVELIDGEVIDMAPIGSNHAGTVGFLAKRLERAVGDSAVVFVQNSLLLTASSEPQPDIMLLKPRTDFYRSAHPHPEDVLLIVEVADTTLAYDRDIKVPLYARHAIPEAWRSIWKTSASTCSLHRPTSVTRPAVLCLVALSESQSMSAA